MKKSLLSSTPYGSKSDVGQNSSNEQNFELFPILKIEEDNQKSYKARNTISTQTNTSHDCSKKGSTSTLWTSEESILRSAYTVDEDNKSTSSSACEEASGVLSSGKSGNSLDSAEIDNENNESGIGTATPPKDQVSNTF